MDGRFTKTDLKVLRSMPRDEAQRMIDAVEAAARGDLDADLKPLVGLPGLGICADYRAIAEFDGDELSVKRIVKRGEAYGRSGAMTRIKLDKVQTITGADGNPTHAVVPWPVWNAIDEALFRTLDPGEESVPADLARRLVAGESPIKVFREHRRLTLAQLAKRVGSTPAYVLQIESGARRAGNDLLRLIARALDVDYDDIALSALPSVADMTGEPVAWNGERDIVSCNFAVDDAPRTISVSLGALKDLEQMDAMTAKMAIGAFERNRECIREAVARAVAEGRRQRDGVLLLVSADF